MRTLAITLCAAALLSTSGVQAQSSPPAPANRGPYILLANGTEQLNLLDVGSRTPTGGYYSVTLVSFMNPAGATPRIDMAIEVDCARKQSRLGAAAIRDDQGRLLGTRMANNTSWIAAGSGSADTAIVKLACEGSYSGQTADDLPMISKVWREQVAGK